MHIERARACARERETDRERGDVYVHIYIYMCLSVSLSLSVCRAHARTVGPRTQYQHTCIGGLWEHAADFPNSKHQEALAIKTYGGYFFSLWFFFLAAEPRHSMKITLGSAHLLYSKCTRALTFQVWFFVPSTPLPARPSPSTSPWYTFWEPQKNSLE